jgi:hypothetical protein
VCDMSVINSQVFEGTYSFRLQGRRIRQGTIAELFGYSLTLVRFEVGTSWLRNRNVNPLNLDTQW